MMPIRHCSTTDAALLHGSTLITIKNYQFAISCLSQKSPKQVSSSQCLPLPLATYRSSYLVHRRFTTHILAAAAIGVAIEEPNSAVEGEGEAPSSVEDATATLNAQSNRLRPLRKSDMPPVKNEELVSGATFTGKVKSIQPFGAFVDFGAFTDGLVHVSQLNDTFVKDVKDVVSLGQEVKVRLVEANLDTKRISLTMRMEDDISNLQQRKDSPGSSSDKSRPARRNTKSSKFVKGQDLEGTVKNLNRGGAFISLPEGEEGYLPISEEYNEGFESMVDGSSLQVGEEVKVRVLRIARGQVTLTMKKEEDIADSNSKVIEGVVHVATNPFARAFRENKEIAAFLDDSEESVASTTSMTEEPTATIKVEDNVTESNPQLEVGNGQNLAPGSVANEEVEKSQGDDTV